MSPLAPEISMLLILAAIFGVGLFSHLHYFVRITNHVRKTTDQAFLKKDLMAAIRIPQGSNFNVVMILSWSLFLVALVFLYFLTPEIFPTLNYFKFPQVASNSFGLAYFGGAIIVFPGILVAIFIPRCYSYYLIPRQLKDVTLYIPAFLLASISCSVYLGTIYPETNLFYWYLGYVSLLVSLVILLAPIANGYMEEMRT